MMSVMRTIRLITVFLLATLSLVAVPCLAQTERGSITGVVTDSSKGAIPGVFSGLSGKTHPTPFLSLPTIDFRLSTRI